METINETQLLNRVRRRHPSFSSRHPTELRASPYQLNNAPKVTVNTVDGTTGLPQQRLLSPVDVLASCQARHQRVQKVHQRAQQAAASPLLPENKPGSALPH